MGNGCRRTITRFGFNIFVIAAILITGCKTNYLSDASMISPIEAFAPEVEIAIDGQPCLTADGKDGACAVIRDEGSKLTFDIMIIPSGEIFWKSNCLFLYNDERVSQGSLITDKKRNRIILDDAPDAGQVCTIGFLILDTEIRDDPMPDSQGGLSLVSVILKSNNYIRLASPQIRINGDRYDLKASRFTRHMLISSRKTEIHLKKTNEISGKLPKRGSIVTIRTQTDNGRRNIVKHTVR